MIERRDGCVHLQWFDIKYIFRYMFMLQGKIQSLTSKLVLGFLFHLLPNLESCSLFEHVGYIYMYIHISFTISQYEDLDQDIT